MSKSPAEAEATPLDWETVNSKAKAGLDKAYDARSLAQHLDDKSDRTGQCGRRECAEPTHPDRVCPSPGSQQRACRDHACAADAEDQRQGQGMSKRLNQF